MEESNKEIVYGEFKEHDFSQSTKWIWASPGGQGAWWMFRRAFELPGEAVCKAVLKITSNLNYLAYINGRLISIGPARSFNFSKVYDIVDISSVLVPGVKNIIALLSVEQKDIDIPDFRNITTGLIAEISALSEYGNKIVISTDGSWHCRRHLSFLPDTGSYFINPGITECYDARMEEQGWTQADFDDSFWQEVEVIGPVGTPPWTAMEPNSIRQLSYDPVYPVCFNAIELARDCEGYHFRLGPSSDRVMVYMTEVMAESQTMIEFSGIPLLYVDGVRVHTDKMFILPEGKHLLCICKLTYVSNDLEIRFITKGVLSFSASRILGSHKAEWAYICFPGISHKYPWHEYATNVIDTIPGLSSLFALNCVDEMDGKFRQEFQPAICKGPTVMDMITSQRFFKVRGGFADIAIGEGQPRMNWKGASEKLVDNANNLLHYNLNTSIFYPYEGMNTHFVLDFGREIIGYVCLELEASEGATIDIHCFEVIDGTGISWMHPYNTFRYICRKGNQTFTSHYRRGFRYMSVTLRNMNKPISFYNIRCYHSAYPVQAVGGFLCSDELLNRIYRISVDTAALCMLDTYVDCPGHEQALWTGDARITALINLLNFGAYDLDQRHIRLVAQTLRPEWVKEFWPEDERYLQGKYLPMGAFPNYPEGGLPIWTFLWVNQCWEHYMYGGSLKDLEENLGYVLSTLDHCRQLINERGLFDMPGAWNLIEWGNNDLSPYGEVTASNVMLVKSMVCASQMAKALGMNELVEKLGKEAAILTENINLLCWDSHRNAYVDTVRDEWAFKKYLSWCEASDIEPVDWNEYKGYERISEQTQTLALICDCVPADRLDYMNKIINRIENGYYRTGSPAGRKSGPPPEKDAPGRIVPIGSPFFLFFSLEAMFRQGEGVIALKVMRRDWGAMLQCGTGTCWETFKINDRRWTRSACHAWSAAPAVYLPAHILGVRPVEAGYRKFIIEPFTGDLLWAKGSVATPYGPIYANWEKREDGTVNIHYAAPDECERVDHPAASS